MKVFDLKNTALSISRFDMANAFNVYTDADLGYIYNLNTTIRFSGIDSLLPIYYTNYTFHDGMSWTSISHDSYKTVALWWLICKFNNIHNPFELPDAGTILKIPTIELRDFLLDEIRGA